MGTLWQGFKGQVIANNEAVFGTQYTSSLVKLDEKGNKLEGKEEIAIKNLFKRPSRTNEDDMLKNAAAALRDEKDMGMMKRCQRKMSQTINSFHLTVPNIDRQNRRTSLKARFDTTIFGFGDTP